jgi:hypothetical protein
MQHFVGGVGKALQGLWVSRVVWALRGWVADTPLLWGCGLLVALGDSMWHLYRSGWVTG